MCTFCREALKNDLCEALRCGHCFHTACLQEYCAATHRSKAQACPYKCNVTDADEAALAGVANSDDETVLELPTPMAAEDSLAVADEIRAAAAALFR